MDFALGAHQKAEWFRQRQILGLAAL